MHAYYKKLRRLGVNMKQEQLRLIWSFKRKRHAGGSLSKHKARLCCHGGQQQYYETYAPVVARASVRAMLVMSKLYNVHTRSIDFVLAYPQAEIRANMYLMAPAGIKINTNGEEV
eukprot:4922604-Ditylum_brightwellii.AAC.1